MVGKAPFEQLRACSILLILPQTQLAGRFKGDQPQRSAIASQKSPLWSAKPWHSNGKMESQEDAPFSLASFKEKCRPADKVECKDEKPLERFVCLIDKAS